MIDVAIAGWVARDTKSQRLNLVGEGELCDNLPLSCLLIIFTLSDTQRWKEINESLKVHMRKRRRRQQQQQQR